MVSKQTCQIQEARALGAAKVHVAELGDWQREWSLEPSGWQRQGRGPLAEESGNTTGRWIQQQRHVQQRSETKFRESDQRQAPARPTASGGNVVAEWTGYRRMGIVQPETVLNDATSVLAGPAATQDC